MKKLATILPKIRAVLLGFPPKDIISLRAQALLYIKEEYPRLWASIRELTYDEKVQLKDELTKIIRGAI